MTPTISGAELLATIAPWGDGAMFTERVLRARAVLHQQIRAHRGRQLLTYGAFCELIDYHTRGRAIANILDAVRALDMANGLPGSPAILVRANTNQPAPSSGWASDDLEYHQRMIARCWMAFDA
jgi:hypothetical protein